MRGFFYRPAVKATMLFLSVVVLAGVLLMLAGTVYLADVGAYTASFEDAQDQALLPLIVRENQTAADVFFGNFGEEGLAQQFRNRNYLVEIYKEGERLGGTYHGQAVIAQETSWSYYYNCSIVGYVPAELNAVDNLSQLAGLFGFLYAARYWFPILAVTLALFELLLWIGLYTAVGRRYGQEGVVLNYFDRIPFDVFTGMLLLELAVLYGFIRLAAGSSDLLMMVALAVAGVLAYLLILWYTLSFAVRIKAGIFFRHFFVVRAAVWLWRFGGRVLRAMPLVWKTALGLLVILGVEGVFVVANRWHAENLIAFGVVERLLLLPPVLYIAWMLRRLQKGGQALSRGDLEHRVNTSHMVGEFKSFGEDLNGINAGLSQAVEQRLKSERLKTELITNVSHDIKTPLTSLINYVDLMKKEPVENERVGEYLEVLDRQSHRLKKLIEDLMEASKASTGNLTVQMERCDVGTLLSQVAGEYEERLRQRDLTLLYTPPADPVYILADGRHMWRVLDNLLNNTVKYAQPATRVYVDLEPEAAWVRILFRNISRESLNISGDELTERFVRGDSSRNTEGSGLGLSIARSLTELQNGTLDLQIDGDLFKVILTFPVIQA